MSNLTNLQTAYSSLITAYTTAAANPKPSYNIDGASVSWESYMKSLLEQIKALEEILEANGSPEFGAFEIRSRGSF